VTVQNETTAGRNRLGTSGPGVWGGHHVHAFAANCEAPSDVNKFFGHMGASLPKMLYAAVAPFSLGTAGCTSPDNSRLKDTAEVKVFADQVIGYLNADASITHVNFWNELKGYYSGTLGRYDRDRFYRDYITFATRVKAAKPAIKIGGPYTTGGMNNTEEDQIHIEFAEKVVKLHPSLVDFIVWDDSGGMNHRRFTNIYSSRGINLPHANAEWYPGGWNTSSPPSVGTYARNLLDMAENPLMRWVMHWGGGSDSTMKARLWDSAGNPTSFFHAMNKVAGFTRHGGVVKLNADQWRNAAGQTLTMSGDTITVS
jgi:hypothetical protein